MARVPALFTPGSLLASGFVGSDPFLTLHREMNRLFDDVIRGGTAATGSQGAMLLAPNMDVTETDNEVRIRAELPGVTEDNIDVSLDDDVLTIRAEKKQERKEDREGTHVSERVFGTFQRALRLPYRVSPDQVQAQFENGVLTVTIPKSQEADRSRRIQVQGRGTAEQGEGRQQGANGHSSGGGGK